MYANDDIYSGPTDPTNKINPKIIGAFYINTTTAKLFVCTNNTINNNTWKICNPDIKMPEIPPPTPMVFTTYNYGYIGSGNVIGPYKPGITYTNTDNKPVCLILIIQYYYTSADFQNFYAALTINYATITANTPNNNTFGSSRLWNDSITGIIGPGATFSIQTTNVHALSYLIIK